MASGLMAEEPAVKWNFKSGKANDAMRKYQAGRKKLADAYDQNRTMNRETLISKLQSEVKSATRSNDLDDAVAIRNAINALNGAHEEAKTAKERYVEPNEMQLTEKEITKLMEQICGNWTVSGNQGQLGTQMWTFHPNFTVTISINGPGRGIWKFEKDRVFIRWLLPQGAWNTFDFPLDEMPVHGACSQNGANSVRATKAVDNGLPGRVQTTPGARRQ